MGQLVWELDPSTIMDLCTIRRPLVWHPDLVPSALLKDDLDESDDDSEHSNDSEWSDDNSEMSN